MCHSLASAIVETIPKVKDEPPDYGGVVELFKCLVKLESDELSQSVCASPLLQA